MMSVVRPLTAFLFLAALGAASANPPQPPTPTGKVSFHREIRPLFQAHCVGCHQPAKDGGTYVMTSRAGLLGMGDSGMRGVVPGKPAESYLIQQIVPKDGKPAPMPKNKPPLMEKEVALISRWINEGAEDDTPASGRQVVDAAHPPVYQGPPVLTSIEYSPDGSLLAVSGYHEVLLWKADGSELVSRLVGTSERIQSLRFSPDGKQLAVAGGSPGRFGEIQVWDVEKKKLTLSHSVTFDTVYGASWSPDGTKIAFGCSDNTLRAIEVESGKQVLYQGAHSDWVLDTSFSRDGDYLVSVGRDRTIKLTEVATQRFIDNITSITPGALKGGLQTVARRPFKERKVVKAANIAIADTREKAYDELLIAGSDGTPRLYKMHREVKRVIGDDANKVREFETMPGRIFAVSFAADADRFAVGSSHEGKGEVRVYNAADGKKLSTFEGIKGPVYTVAFHPDGLTVASAGFDGTVRLHAPMTGKLVKEFVGVPMGKPATTGMK